MKRLKRLSMASVMILVLAIPTLAGIIHTGVVDPPPPPPPEESSMLDPSTPTALGDIHTGVVSSDLGTVIVLNLLQLLSVY